MIKIATAITIFAYTLAALFVLPGFAPPQEFRLVLAKGDRLPARVLLEDCSQQMWPNFSTACLHGTGPIDNARLISVRG